jgi:hypothetical protein
MGWKTLSNIQNALHKPVLSVHVNHHQSTNNSIHPTAFNAKVHLEQHSFHWQSDVKATEAARKSFSLEIEVDV